MTSGTSSVTSVEVIDDVGNSIGHHENATDDQRWVIRYVRTSVNDADERLE